MSRRHRCRIPLASLALVCLGGAAPDPAAALVAWRRALELPGLDAVSAVALDPSGARLAVGDAHGVRLLEAGAPVARPLRRGPVWDLRFAADGTLHAATERGLFAIDRAGAVVEDSPGPGAARTVRRLAGVAGWLFAAGADGVHLRRGEARWERLGDVRSGQVDALAARSGAGGTELWVVVAGEVERVELGPGVAATAPRVHPIALPGGSAGRDVRDVALAVPGADVVLLGSERLLLRRAGRWEPVPLPLPPGATALRLGRGAGRLWIATDAGLLEAPGVAGPWRRAAPPAGRARAVAVAGDARNVFAAIPDGLLHGSVMPARPRAPAGGLPAGVASQPDATDPSVLEVQRSALRYLDLGPERLGALRAGVDRRGWLPELLLRGGYGEGRRRSRDLDEIVTSGARHSLRDRALDRERDWDVSLSLAWDLGDTRYHPEAIDVSREAREVIELRDDVLDEIVQLYFERQRVRLALAALPGDATAERARLALRARELSAGLDAWTGGWFSFHTAPDGPRHFPSPPDPGTETQP